jgi:CBS domain containing-hemolysin-like protein
MPPEEAMRAVIDSPYTRYPVFRETLDDVVGILHVRDLFSAMVERGIAQVHLEDLLRPAHIVPETKDLASLLQEFRRTNTHFAVVVDEYGAMAGILTLEDLLEEIVGEIEDEFDIAEEQIEQIIDDTYRISGMFPIDEFNERFGTESGRGFPYGRRLRLRPAGTCARARRRRRVERRALRRARGGRQPDREDRRQLHRAPAARRARRATTSR